MRRLWNRLLLWLGIRKPPKPIGRLTTIDSLAYLYKQRYSFDIEPWTAERRYEATDPEWSPAQVHSR